MEEVTESPNILSGMILSKLFEETLAKRGESEQIEKLCSSYQIRSFPDMSVVRKNSSSMWRIKLSSEV